MISGGVGRRDEESARPVGDAGLVEGQVLRGRGRRPGPAVQGSRGCGVPPETRVGPPDRYGAPIADCLPGRPSGAPPADPRMTLRVRSGTHRDVRAYAFVMTSVGYSLTYAATSLVLFGPSAFGSGHARSRRGRRRTDGNYPLRRLRGSSPGPCSQPAAGCAAPSVISCTVATARYPSACRRNIVARHSATAGWCEPSHGALARRTIGRPRMCREWRWATGPIRRDHGGPA
jgi:hypothetical protein